MECIIERGEKDAQHPFAQIARTLINDENVSVDLRFLIIYCISKPDTWKYNITNMANVMKCSKRKLYMILKEGENNGYITREQRRDTGERFMSVVYKIYEFKREIKNKFPNAKNRFAENRHAEICTHSNTEATTVAIEIEKEEYSNKPPAQAAASADAVNLTDLFLKSCKARDPGIEPNAKLWAKELDKLLKSGRKAEEIASLLGWIEGHKFWQGVILAPKDLVKNYSKLIAQLRAQPEITNIELNRRYALELQAQFPDIKGFSFNDKYILFHKLGKELALRMNPEEFKRAFAGYFGYQHA